MWNELLKYFWRSAVRFFATERLAKFFTILGFLAAGAFFALVVYIFFRTGFGFIARDEYFREALTLYVIELFLLVTFLLAYLSALATGIFSLFRTGKDLFLFASPRYTLRISLTFLRMFTSSLWPLLIMVIPAFVALRHVYGFSFAGIFIALVSVIALVGLANALAVILLIVSGMFLRLLRAFSIRATGVLALLVSFAAVAHVWGMFRSVNLITLFQARVLTDSSASIVPILEQFENFPSHLSALSVVFGLRGDLSGGLPAMFAILTLTLAMILALWPLSRAYLPLWQLAGERSSRQRLGPIAGGLILRSGTQTAAMFAKEVIGFLRDTRGMMWTGFVLMLWGIQLAASHTLVFGLAEERLTDAELPRVVIALQLVLVLYFVLMFSLRFAFPAFSAERRVAWIVDMAPVDLRRFFDAKLVFFSALLIAIALIFTVSGALTLGESPLPEFFLLVAILVGTVFLAIFGLSFGVMFPNRDTDDPEILSTSLSGMTFIILAVLYGVFGGWSVYLVERGSVIAHAAYLLGTILFSGYLIWRARGILRDRTAP